jgi:UDP-N-acetylmuramoylalanine--D-glutamate ligase
MKKTPDLKNKSVLVVGLGQSGAAAARLLISRGARVTIADERPRSQLGDPIKSLPRGISFILGKSQFLKSQFDLVIVSPGVPADHRELIKARQQGIPVWPELELGWQHVSPKCTIAITGTNGKTTTTAWLGHILKTSKRPTIVGGNIGTPLSALVNRVNNKTFLVLEVSSYQLEVHQTFHPQVGVVLNLTPDHLARHKTMAQYARIKNRLFENSTSRDWAIFNGKDKWGRKMAKQVQARTIFFPTPLLRKMARGTTLPGFHNQQNAMAAVAATLAAGVSLSHIKKGICTFRGVAHRFELIKEAGGVRYVNDSKSTNVDSTWVALEASDRPTYLILGGLHKGSSYKPLIPLIRSKVKEILTIGEAHPIIAKDLKGIVPIEKCQTLGKAVQYAVRMASTGEQVLLSPACASFDQYQNFEKRGHHFESLVRKYT